MFSYLPKYFFHEKQMDIYVLNLVFFLFSSCILKVFLEVLTYESFRERGLNPNVTLRCTNFKHSLVNARLKFTELTKCLRKYRFTE